MSARPHLDPSRLRIPLLRRPVRLPRSPGVAWVLAVAGPTLIALVAYPFRSSLGLGGVLFCTLLAVVVVAGIGGVRPALLAVVVGFLAGVTVFARSLGSLHVDRPVDLVALVAFVVVGGVVGILVDDLTRLLEEQAALRRVATLVARGASPEELFASVTEEVGQLLPVDVAALGRYGADGTAHVVTGWTKNGDPVPTGILSPGDPGDGGAGGRKARFRSSVETAIVVEGLPWGVMAAASLERRLPRDTQTRLASFTDLLATAIANAKSGADLAASRARLVTTADETRRRIERDLHDGAQQRLVSLGLELRAAQAAVPQELGELRRELSEVADGLSDVQGELREMARGIHPAMLAEGGLGTALKTLARRSPVPVVLDVNSDARLPEPIEVAAYYVVSESLTNVAKHAHASVVHVHVEAADRALRITVRDDGEGGADPGGGSGLIGLKDRVEALGGTLAVESPAGAGTSVQVELPLGA